MIDIGADQNCSWFDLANEIFDILGEDIRKTTIKSSNLLSGRGD